MDDELYEFLKALVGGDKKTRLLKRFHEMQDFGLAVFDLQKENERLKEQLKKAVQMAKYYKKYFGTDPAALDAIEFLDLAEGKGEFKSQFRKDIEDAEKFEITDDDIKAVIKDGQSLQDKTE